MNHPSPLRSCWTALALVALVHILGPRLAAQPVATEETARPPAKPAPDGHRFLFVVETSAETRKSEELYRQAVFDLITGGLHGQMRTGDTFGIWTFSDEVQAGEFPMTVFDSERALEIAGQAAAFLKERKYAKKADLKSLVRELRLLSERAADFDCFVVSSGRQRFEGTPFDEKVNLAYDAFAERPSKLARIPLVTGFVVRQGRPIRAAVVLAGERIALPNRPPPFRAATNAAPAKAIARAEPPKAESETSASNPAGPAPENPSPLPAPQAKVMQIVTLTNRAAELAQPVGANPTVATTVNAAPPPPPLPASPPPAGAPSLVGEAGHPHLASSNAAATVGSTVGAGGPPTNVSTPTTKPALAASSAVATTASSPDQAPAPAPTGGASSYAVTPISRILEAAVQASAENPMPVAAREPAAAAASASPAPASALPPVAAVAAAPASVNPIVLLAIGATLLVATIALTVIVLRRLPSSSRGSLISQSMRQE